MILLSAFFGLAQAYPSVFSPMTSGGTVDCAKICVTSTDTGQMTGGDGLWALNLGRAQESMLSGPSADFLAYDATVDIAGAPFAGTVGFGLDGGLPTGELAALLYGDLDSDGVDEAITAVVVPNGDGSYDLLAGVYYSMGAEEPVGEPSLWLEGSLRFGASGYALLSLPAWSLDRWTLSTADGTPVTRGGGGLLSWSADLGTMAYEALAVPTRTGWSVAEYAMREGALGAGAYLAMGTQGRSQMTLSYESLLDTATATRTGLLTGASNSGAWGYVGAAVEQPVRGSATTSGFVVLGNRAGTWTATNGGKYVSSAALPNGYTAPSTVEADATVADLLDAIATFGGAVDVSIPSTSR